MILPDLNLLIYAHNPQAPHHTSARQWWEDCMNGSEDVGIPWAVSCGFVRLVTHRRVFVQPLNAKAALDIVDSWFARHHVSALNPGPEHLPLLREMLEASGHAGSLTTDAHLAALALEHRCTLHSNDRDMARFPRLQRHNPLA